MIACQSKTLFMVVSVWRAGLRFLWKTLLQKDLRIVQIKVRKYEATYVKYGFIALQKNGLDYRHVIWLYSYSKNNAAIIKQ